MLLALLLALTARALPEQLARSVATADCAAVLEALPEPTAPDERLAAGWCLERTGRSAEALEVLALEGDGVLQEYARWIRSEALVDAGRQDEAIAALEGLTLPDPTGIRVRLLRGRALVEAERSLEARDDLRALLSTDVGVEARYWLAIGGEQRGATEAAIATFRRTWAEAAAGPWAELAAEHLEALGHPVPELHSAAGRELVMDRVRTLWEHQQNAEALALLQAIRQEDPPDSRHERLQLARAHFMGRDYPGAVAAWREVLGDPDEAQGSATDLFDYALGTSRIGDYPTAALIYRRLIAVHPDTTQADLASFKLGYLEYDRHQLEQAIPLLEAHVATRPGSSHLDEALWFTGRCQWRLGEWEAAVRSWDALIERRPRSGLVPAARYWKARALGEGGDEAGEQSGLDDVIRRHPTSGYAWYAAARLGRTWPRQAVVERPPWPDRLADRPEVLRGETLLAAGFQDWARVELMPIAAVVSGREESLAAAHALIRAGAYRRGRSLAEPWCVSPWKGGDPLAQQACHPRPEAGVVASVSSAYDLPPLVPFGVMTAESGLQPEVVSWAGARGLMQLMPVEAGRIHDTLYPDRPYDPDDLFSAPYNASLGTAELGMKLQSLQGSLQTTSVPAAVAAYNGGEEAVRRWLARYEDPPPFDEFAEDIGYTETRRYVRRVLGFTMAYRWVYGDTP